MSLVSVAWPDSELEAAMMASLLYAHGIPFFVRNATSAGTLPREQISGHNHQIVLVPERAAAFAIELLSGLAQPEAGTEVGAGRDTDL